MDNDPRIMVPVAIAVPTAVVIVPPFMVLIPAALSFSTKSVPSGVSLRTVGAMALNFVVKSGPRVFNAMLAP